MKAITGTVISCALVLGASSTFAHHAFTAQYDSERPQTLHGVVVKVEWLNPHAYFYVNVADEDTGGETVWAVELGSPVSLMRRGWTRNSLQAGDVVDVAGILARDGSPALNAETVVLTATGRRLFGRSAEDESAAEQSP